MINEVDNVTREELRLSDNVMMCCKPITEQKGTEKMTIRRMLFLLHGKIGRTVEEEGWNVYL